MPTPTPKGNLLIVDDTPANLRLLSTMLTEQGYKVRSVINGPMALTATQAAPPDLILLDITMPEMSGYEVCQQLKANEQTCDIPIIFISALDEVEDKVHAFIAGGVDYITKPFQVEEVLMRVETHLTLRQLQKALQTQNTQLQQEICERQRAEEEREKLIQELDAFAHTVAHDLKGPLSYVIGYTELLKDEGNEEARQSYIAAIIKGAHKMNNIIKELLLLAKMRRTEVSLRPLPMAEIVQEALHRFVFVIQEEQAEVILPPDWPPALGYGPWVEEVWSNYISNALKYGGRPPQLELGGELQPDGMVRFWVKDNGRGLSLEEQAKLFTPFVRLDEVRAEGHGLGLSIVQRIVEKLGGTVGVTSWPGAGSSFSFTLLVAKEKLSDYNI
jgi:signal transduction histidine kinase